MERTKATSRPNPAYFAHIEDCIAELRKINIEADLILFHPYDRWGYATMSAADDDRYLRYLLARMSAYRNIWWSMANEWDFMKAKSRQDFDRFFHIIPSNRTIRYRIFARFTMGARCTTTLCRG